VSVTVPESMAPTCARDRFGMRKEKARIPNPKKILAPFRFILSPSLFTAGYDRCISLNATAIDPHHKS
jgi:hypothetical protein